MKVGTPVKVAYSCWTEDGTLIDSSAEHGGSITFAVGMNRMLAGFEEAVAQMRIGESRIVKLSPHQACGIRNEELVRTEKMSDIPGGRTIAEHSGEYINMNTTDGPMQGRVIDNEDGTITIDFNHPYAGKALIFSVTLLDLPKPDLPADCAEPGISSHGSSKEQAVGEYPC